LQVRGCHLDRDRFDTEIREYRSQTIDVAGIRRENRASTQTYRSGHYQSIDGSFHAAHSTLKFQECRDPRHLLGRWQNNQIFQRLIRSSVSLVTMERFRKDHRRHYYGNAGGSGRRKGRSGLFSIVSSDRP
jgi:hypothetical protein